MRTLTIGASGSGSSDIRGYTLRMSSIAHSLAAAIFLGMYGCSPEKDSLTKTDSGTENSENNGLNSDSGGPSSPPVPTANIGPVIPCEAPAERATWTEQSEAFGLPFRPDDGRKTEEATFLLVDDFDRDGHLDLITSVFGESETRSS